LGADLKKKTKKKNNVPDIVKRKQPKAGASNSSQSSGSNSVRPQVGEGCRESDCMKEEAADQESRGDGQVPSIVKKRSKKRGTESCRLPKRSFSRQEQQSRRKGGGRDLLRSGKKPKDHKELKGGRKKSRQHQRVENSFVLRNQAIPKSERGRKIQRGT